MERGRFTGVGVGPGDPELMTIKAVKAIEKADVLILPTEDKEKCRAYKIAEAAVCDMGDKEYIFEPFPMTMDKEELEAFHKRTAGKIAGVLDEGKNAAFLTIGDPAVYSTLDYIALLLEDMGYETDRISGVTSFSAAAARLGISLGEGSESIHIIPGAADTEEALKLTGTRVFMKSGRKLKDLKERLVRYEAQTGSRVYGVLNCGLPDEKTAYSAHDIPDDWGYMAVVIVK
ncbi:MAG: precorrin-2 C(20)-methyltransferase [Lachnospiraceae bacterium]|nr:precorrin-2 C(20)-methyltransferase [Lachnospiraceae bacterium]